MEKIMEKTSIGDHLAYQQALNELLVVEVRRALLTDEESPTYTLSGLAAEAAWDAVTATVDAYVARRLAEQSCMEQGGSR